jgi:anti-sigma-K factor RskA
VLAQEALQADGAVGESQNFDASSIDGQPGQVDQGDNALGGEFVLGNGPGRTLDPASRALDRDGTLAEACELVRVTASAGLGEMPPPCVEHRLDAAELHRREAPSTARERRLAVVVVPSAQDWRLLVAASASPPWR